jgi:hypothetical protein
VPRIVPRQEAEKELTARGCQKIKEYVFETGSLWKTADGKFYFVVPQGIGGWMYEDVLRDIFEMLSKR